MNSFPCAGGPGPNKEAELLGRGDEEREIIRCGAKRYGYSVHITYIQCVRLPGERLKEAQPGPIERLCHSNRQDCPD